MQILSHRYCPHNVCRANNTGPSIPLPGQTWALSGFVSEKTGKCTGTTPLWMQMCRYPSGRIRNYLNITTRHSMQNNFTVLTFTPTHVPTLWRLSKTLNYCFLSLNFWNTLFKIREKRSSNQTKLTQTSILLQILIAHKNISYKNIFLIKMIPTKTNYKTAIEIDLQSINICYLIVLFLLKTI